MKRAVLMTGMIAGVSLQSFCISGILKIDQIYAIIDFAAAAAVQSQSAENVSSPGEYH